MRRFLVTGASGQLGSYLLRQLATAGCLRTAWTGSTEGCLFGCPLRPVDLARADAVAQAFREARPDVVLHAAAMARVSDCWQRPEQARLVNRRGSQLLAELAGQAGARLVLVSTDLVFDGARGWYCEEDAPAPMSIYARTKAAAEAAVLSEPNNLVVRVSLLFGPSLTGRATLFDEQVTALRQRRPIRLFADEWRTPLSLATAAQALVSLACSGIARRIHLGGPNRLSRLEMGQQLASHLRADPAMLVATTRDQQTSPEPRPRDTSLDSSRWRALFPEQPWPSFSEALADLLSR